MTSLKPKGATTRSVEVGDLRKPPSRSWDRKFVDTNALSCVENPHDAGRALEALQKVGQLTFGSTLEVSQLATRAVRFMVEHGSAARGALVSLKRGRSQVMAFYQAESAQIGGSILRVDRGTLEYVLDTQTTVGYSHWLGRASYPMAYLPLRRPGSYQVMACLCLERATGEARFEECDLEIMTLLTSHIAMALERVVTLERLRKADRQREIRARIDAVLDAIPEGIAVVGEDGQLEGLNRGARNLFRDHTPRGATTIVNTFNIGDLVAQVFNTGEPRSRDVRVDDDKILQVSAYTAQPPSPSGPRCVAVVFRDVTDQRARESHLLETERSRALGEGLAGIAHELNNPLTSIVGFVDLLADQVDPAHADTCRLITEQAERCLTLAREVLTFSRRPKRKDLCLDLPELVERTLHLLDRPLVDGAIEVVTEFAPELPVFADPHQVQQVLMNLIQNAAQALVEGEAPHRRISIRTFARGERVEVAVEDSGVGIEQSVCAKLFDPFFSTRPKGNGLGLSISSKIVREYGGELTVESRPGRTTFRFDLPRASQPSSATAPAPASLDPLESGVVRVLAVDDEEPILLCIRGALKSDRYSVEVETDGQAALDRISPSSSFDVLIMDVRMPGLGGLEVLERLRDQRSPLASRCILMTGEVDEEILERVRNSGALLLPKPFRIHELVTLIEVMTSPDSDAETA